MAAVRFGSPVRILAASALASCALLSAAAPARAAFGVVNPVAQPATTQAGAQTELQLGFDIAEPDKQLRDLFIDLPPGLVGNPQAVPQCAAAAFEAGGCDPASAVGSSTTMATVILPPPFATPTALHGTIYNLVPNQGEPGRLGLNINSPMPGVVPDIRKQIAVTLRPDYGLTTELSGLPSQMLGINIYVAAVSLTLNEQYISNPSSCDVALTRFRIRSHAMAPDAPPVSGLADFKPTGCDAQPYDPQAKVTVGDGSVLSPATSPPVSSTITQEPGEANSRRVEITLPAGLIANVAVLDGAYCQPPDFDAGACAPADRVGEAEAATPLLADPLAGEVFLVDSGSLLPRLGLDLRGALELKLLGDSSLVGSRLRSSFDDLPDLPLPSFTLSFDGGPNGLFTFRQELCSGDRAYDAAYTSHGDRLVSERGTAALLNCPPADQGQVAGKKKKCKRKGKKGKKKAKAKKCKRKKRKRKK